jgi:hypothetical protein
LFGLLGVVEVQPMPIDDRLALEDQTKRLDVVKSQLVDGSEPRRTQIAGALTGTRDVFVVGVDAQVLGRDVEAVPGAGRLSDRVPKNIPSVTPRTATCAPTTLLPSRRINGTRATRYKMGDFTINSICELPGGNEPNPRDELSRISCVDVGNGATTRRQGANC